MMIMENHTKDSFYTSIPKIENAKDLLYAISNKYTNFSKNEKKELYNNHLVNVCFGSNIIDVPSDTWWLDSGATIHACNSMQAVICKRSPTSLEQYVYMEEGTRVQVDFLGVVRLQLSTGNFLKLQDVVYIPWIMRNLILVPILDRLECSFFLGTGKVNLYRGSLLIDDETLCGNLYRLGLYSLLSFSPNVNTVSSTKHLKLNDKSSII